MRLHALQCLAHVLACMRQWALDTEIGADLETRRQSSTQYSDLSKLLESYAFYKTIPPAVEDKRNDSRSMPASESMASLAVELEAVKQHKDVLEKGIELCVSFTTSLP